MSKISLIMPTVLAVALLFILPALGATGSAVFVLAVALAVCAWTVGRVSRAVAGHFLRTGNSCMGLLPTLVITFGGGFFAPLILIGFLSGAVPGAAAVANSAILISAIVCFGGFALRLLVTAISGEAAGDSRNDY